MLWIKSLHIVFVVSWFAGLFYLPRIFVNLAQVPPQSIAERVQTQVAKLKVTASVQRVAVDNDVWHRVRVGPIKDLQELNRVREVLQSADLESLVVRIE